MPDISPASTNGAVPEITDGARSPVLLPVVGFVLRNRRLILWSAAAVGALALVTTLILPRRYEATVAFTPAAQRKPNLGAVAGLASQMGIQLDLGGSTDALPFYATLVRSREILRRLASTEFVVRDASGTAPRSAPLVTLLDVKGKTPTERMQHAIEKLDDLITVRTNTPANLIEVKVAMSSASLAEQVTNRLWQLINEFNLQRRQAQASAERVFLEERVKGAQSDLADAEATLASFMAHNRSYQNSPELGIENDRLRRRVDMRQQVLTSLLQNVESARLDEVRNTPLVTPVDLPDGSGKPKSRMIVLSTLLGLIFGAFLGIGLGALRETIQGECSANPDEYESVAALVRRRGGARRSVADVAR